MITTNTLKTLQKSAEELRKLYKKPGVISAIEQMKHLSIKINNPETTRVLENNLRLAQINVQKLKKIIEPSIPDTLIQVSKLNSQLSEITNNINKTFFQLKPFIDSINNTIQRHHELFKPALIRLGRFAVLVTEKRQLYQMIADNGWPVTQSIPIDLIEEKKLTAKEIDSFVIDYFEESEMKNLRSMVSSIKKSVKAPRTRLITEIYNSYKSENFSACVSLALTQLEGISAEFLINKASSEPELKEELSKKNIIRKNPSSKRKKKVIVALEEIYKAKKNLSIIEYFASKITLELIQSKVFGHAGKHEINLHAGNILHGTATGYGTKKNALVSILLIDLVTNIKY